MQRHDKKRNKAAYIVDVKTSGPRACPSVGEKSRRHNARLFGESRVTGFAWKAIGVLCACFGVYVCKHSLLFCLSGRTQPPGSSSLPCTANEWISGLYYKPFFLVICRLEASFANKFDDLTFCGAEGVFVVA